MNESLQGVAKSLATKVARSLAENKTPLVLAESCTAGLVSATLAGVPGISAWLCGSAVVYMEDTKRVWLGVDPDTLADHTAVSDAVAREMIAGVLDQTPHATLAAAVTGHLGPGAPPEQDGLVYIGTGEVGQGHDEFSVSEFRLLSTDRAGRQMEACVLVLREVLAALGESVELD